MHSIILAALGLLILASAGGSATHCTTRYDEALQRWESVCTDGSRATTHWDAGLQRYDTSLTKAPQGHMPPRSWPTPGKAPPR
jgi:hypothetical protein